MHPPKPGAAQIKECGARPRNDQACRAARRGRSQCRAAELLAGGGSGSSTIENGNPDWRDWNDGVNDNAVSRA